MITINNRNIGDGSPCFIISELSANHTQRFDNAVELVKQAKLAGADAIKVQLYSPDTHTLPIEDPNSDFYIKTGLWSGNSLWSLYQHTYMPWAWYPDLLDLAESLDIILFPTVYDLTSLEYAEKYATPAYKIASFEIGDRDLLDAIAVTGKPTFVSLGCASADDIDYVMDVFERCQCPLSLLHCTSEYPANPDSEVFDALDSVCDGISDHTVGIGLPLLCVANGASVVEKHFWLGHGECADQEFSLSPNEFQAMVSSIRAVEHTLNTMDTISDTAESPQNFQRSIYVVKDIVKGEVLTKDNIRIIRPGYGLDPRLYRSVLGKSATTDILYGTALKDEHFIK